MALVTITPTPFHSPEPGKYIMGFELNKEERQRLGYKLIDHINDYFSTLEERPVQLPAGRRRWPELADSMPELGEDAGEVLDETCRELVAKGFHVPSANHFGLMSPTPTYIAVLAEALVAALNPQLASSARPQLASRIERETIRWIGERVGWAGNFDGTFTSGGSEANSTALALALAAGFPDVIEHGVCGLESLPVFYASSEAHHSLEKAAGLLGIGRRSLRRIEVTGRMQLDTEKLEQAMQRDCAAGYKPFCVVATAGTTNSGAVDDIVRLSEICRRHQIWLHVDGAYGAALIFSDRHRHLIPGIGHADSITLDPHKWLAMPYAAGTVLTRHPEMLPRVFGIHTPYMPKAMGGELPDNFAISAQWSRRMNSLKLWLTLRIHGRLEYERTIDRQLALARQFAAWIKTSENFELAAPQVLPIINVRLKNASRRGAGIRASHSAIVEAVTQSGQRWISETMVHGESVIRIIVISYLTRERHLRQLQKALTEAARMACDAEFSGVKSPFVSIADGTSKGEWNSSEVQA